jgi:D-alanyl-D-alanine carboxypeptidase (penicillin-binding protein 5/6)
VTTPSGSHRQRACALLAAGALTLSGVVGTVAAAAPAVAAATPPAPTTPTTTAPGAPARPSATGAPANVVGGPRLASPGVVVDLPPGVPRPPAMKAASYVVADLDTGAVLVAKAAHAPHLPASALKSLTAVTLLPRLDQNTRVRAEPTDVVEGSKVGISPGSTYTARQLFQGMMLSSGNDAAMALARAAGGVPQTVARMQTVARGLGARDTVVRNPSGLDAPGQVTSAYDLALVARAGLRLPAFRQLVATRRVSFPGREVRGKRRTGYQIQNHNRLLANYAGAIGVKNGYTVAARWSVAGAATRGGRTYVVTALTRGDGSWRPTAALLDWAFAHGGQARAVGRLVSPGELERTPSTAASPPPSQPARAQAADRPVGASERPAPSADNSSPAADPTAARTGSAGHVGRTVLLGTLAAAALGLLLLLVTAPARRRRLRAARPARPGARPPR